MTRTVAGERESLWLRNVVGPAPRSVERRPGDAAQLGLGALGFGISAYLSSPERLSQAERQVFLTINGLPGALYPALVSVMQAGSFPAVFVAGGLALLARRRRLAITLVTGGTAVWLTVKVAKAIADRGRPDTLIAQVIIRGGAQSGLGFPSGHAAMAAFIATVAGPYLTRPARIVLWVGALLVAFTRLYVGAHLPLDAIGGLFFGWGAGSLVNLVFGRPAALEAAGAATTRTSETKRAA